MFVSYQSGIYSHAIQNNNRGNLIGFLDIPWNANIDIAEKLMEDHGYIKHPGSKDDLLVYSGAFAGKESRGINIHFFKNRFYSATVIYHYEDEILKYFTAYLSENYGEPDISADDGNIYHSEWDFSNDTRIYISVFDKYIYINYDNIKALEEIENWKKQNPEQVEIKRQEIRKSQIEYFGASLYFAFLYYSIPDVDKSDQKTRFDELYQEAKKLFELTDSQLDTIKNKQLYIGMHYTLVFLAWGMPKDKIKTIDISGEHIKYVYERWPGKYKYAYTDNGFLTSWQE
jgi:hypothetical protein